MEKVHIASTLGEHGLVLPSLINAALAANDRSKYYFTLLQAAAAHARRPDSSAPALKRERLACGVADASLDTVTAAARAEPGGGLRIPSAGAIVRALTGDVGTMLVPFRDDPGLDFAARFEALRSHADCLQGDTLGAADVDAMTSAERAGRDSLHLLVMDLHKALNAAQARIATENLDGASAYAIDDADRPLIAAFMRGLRRTAPLKFEHPGLGTTATRSGAKLVIQNDIGTTDAHVLIVHVEGLAATLTYSDAHLQRLLFFQNQFEGRGVDWNDTFSRRDESMEDGVYHLCEGRFQASGAAELGDYLAFLASRLVFLIDWNKARKRLRMLVSKDEAVRLLAWAARNDHGHMGLLKAGGELLVYDALDFVLKGQARFGRKLDEILGKREAGDFMRFVLKTCSEASLRGESDAFMQDAVRAELFNSLRTMNDQLYDIVAEHAALMVEIAGGVRDSLLQLHTALAPAVCARNAERAKEWESRADGLVNRARGVTKQAVPADFFRTVVETADNVADELEDAAFNLTLLPAPPERAEAQSGLPALGELLVHASQEYVKTVESARHVRRGGAREDIQDFLGGIHRIQQIEHEADEAQRGIKRALLGGTIDPRALHVLLAVARNLEQAADALMHCAHQLRDHVLGDVLTK